MFKTYIAVFIFCFGWIIPCLAQDSTAHRGKKYNTKEAAVSLKKSFDKNDEVATALEYEKLAKELVNTGAYAKAESYLLKAQEIYKRNSDKKRLAENARSLGKVQEQLNKKQKAISNYESASKYAPNKTMVEANRNDASRLRNFDNAAEKQVWAEKNVELFEKENKKEELADAYSNVAESQLKQGKTEEADVSIRRALDVKPTTQAVSEMAKTINKSYINEKKTDKAIELSENVLNKTEQQQNTKQQIEQLRNLAAIYEKDTNMAKSEALLKEAYRLALAEHNVLQTKEAVLALTDLYTKQNRVQEAFQLQQSYLQILDSLVQHDSTLIDTKIFESTEARIQELEKERALQMELMNRKTRFNYFLLAGILVLTLLSAFIAKALMAIRKKNKKIALQSLRREMNPHFIFNSLNSVNQFIAENDELQANKYLTNYSGLMRNVMENANKDYVTLRTELEQLKKYLELEHLRFHDQFIYTINIDEQLDLDAVWIPNMLIQPNLENAIWHGLRYKAEQGILALTIAKPNDDIEITIKDNGIGLAKSKTIKTQNQKAYKSRGLLNTYERIHLLNSLYHTRISLQLTEIPEQQGGGTLVSLIVPQVVFK